MPAFFLIFAMTILSFSASGEGARKVYDCALKVESSTTGALLVQSFQADELLTDLDKAALTFQSEDEKTLVMVAADSRMMIVQWLKDGKLISAGMMQLENSSEEKRVLMLMNPADVNEKLTIACQPNFKLGF